MSKNIIITAVIIAAYLSGGCAYFQEPKERLSFEEKPYTSQLPENYHKIEVNKSSSAEVLSVIHREDKEFLSQSESIIASSGVRKKGSQLWYSLIAFDEESLLVSRKYFMAADEKSHHLFAEDQKFFFDAVLSTPQEIMNEPYPDNNTRKLELIKYIDDQFSEDSLALVPDSKTFHSGVLMTKQTLNTLVNKFEASPAQLANIHKPEGLPFDHMNFDGGRVRMLVDNELLRLRIKVGYKPWGFEWNIGLEEMDK
jgi:hypothetical protein